MHEWGIALHVIEDVVDNVQKSQMKKARKVIINLGQQMHITRDDFLFALRTITNKLEAFNGCEFDIRIIEDSNMASLEDVILD